MNLHNMLRPKNYGEVLGQPSAVSIQRGWISTKQIPQAVAFLGDTGTGKTSMARLLARNVNRDHPSAKPIEYNCADNRGLDLIRDSIEPQLVYAPMDGSNRVFILDELCQLPKTTQQAMLKLIEEPPPWAYFFGCTTLPAKFERAFIDRFKQVQLKPIPASVITKIIENACAVLKRPLDATVVEALADRAEGSARKALGDLEKVLGTGNDIDAQLATIEADSTDIGLPVDLCRLFFRKTPVKWQEASAILKDMTEPPETARRIILAYANKVLLGGNPLAGYVIRKFEYSFDQSGEAGLTVAVWDVIHRR